MQPVSMSIKGPRLLLRLVDVEDSAYICGLRTNPFLSRHLSAVGGTVRDQRRWIGFYKEREARGDEFYFMVERHDNLPCGTVRIYDITGDSFTWGSWVLDPMKPRKAALESAVLSFGFAFIQLNLNLARINVRHDNQRAIKFYRRFGMKEVGNAYNEIEFEYTRDQFVEDQPHYLSILESE